MTDGSAAPWTKKEPTSRIAGARHSTRQSARSPIVCFVFRSTAVRQRVRLGITSNVSTRLRMYRYARFFDQDDGCEGQNLPPLYFTPIVSHSQDTENAKITENIYTHIKPKITKHTRRKAKDV